MLWLPSFLLLHGAVEFMALTLISSPLPLALILAPKGLAHYLRQHFLDKTFVGLYQVNAFDLALLIPYFIVLIILAAYGAHRYWLVYLYYKHKEKKTVEPSAHFPVADMPRVTVQLPIFNEQYVVDRLLDAVCRLEYPKDRLDIQLLDDSTDESARAYGDKPLPLDMADTESVKVGKNVTRHRIEYNTTDGLRIPAYLFIPKTDKPVPVIIVYHGHGAGKIAAAEGDMLRTQMAILRRLAKCEPADTIAVGRQIAARVIKAGRYAL